MWRWCVPSRRKLPRLRSTTSAPATITHVSLRHVFARTCHILQGSTLRATLVLGQLCPNIPSWLYTALSRVACGTTSTYSTPSTSIASSAPSRPIHTSYKTNNAFSTCQRQPLLPSPTSASISNRGHLPLPALYIICYCWVKAVLLLYAQSSEEPKVQRNQKCQLFPLQPKDNINSKRHVMCAFHGAGSFSLEAFKYYYFRII